MFERAKEAIEKAKRVLLISHVNPDGDALGSSLAMFNSLQRTGSKRVRIVNVSDDLPRSYDFLPGFEKISKTFSGGYDLAIAFDCASFDRLGVDKIDAPLIGFDHHPTNEGFADIDINDPSYSSTGELVYDFLKSSGFVIDKNVALCLYSAIVSDTGFFRYENVNSALFKKCSELVELGVDPSYVADMITQRESLAKLRLKAKILDTLTLYLNARVAVVKLTQDMLKSTGAAPSDAEEAANMARSLATVEVGVLLREEPNGDVKVSLRSKRFVDVSKAALIFGGGGHKRAAGFTVKGKDFDTVLKEVLDILKKELA